MVYKKGYLFERDLRMDLEKKGWLVIRSGKSRKPDLIAGKGGKIIIIECKVTEKGAVYLDKAEVEFLGKISAAFGADAVYAIKRNGSKKWNMVGLDQLREAGKSYVVKL